MSYHGPAHAGRTLAEWDALDRARERDEQAQREYEQEHGRWTPERYAGMKLDKPKATGVRAPGHRKDSFR